MSKNSDAEIDQLIKYLLKLINFRGEKFNKRDHVIMAVVAILSNEKEKNKKK